MMFNYDKQVQQANINGCTIEYLYFNQGKSETILFVHGLGLNMRLFYPNIEFFKKYFNVLLFSQRGHGSSQLPFEMDCNTLSLAAFAKDIKVLLDTLGINEVNYVGNSFGGIVGFEFLKNHAEKLRSLTIYGSPIRMNSPRWFTTIVALPTLVLPKIIGRNSFSKLNSRLGVINHKYRSFMTDVFLSANYRVNYDLEILLSRYDYLEVFKNAQLKKMIIRGELDKNKPIDKCIPYLNQSVLIRNIKGAGHLQNIDKVDEFNRVIYEFIA